MSAWTDVTRAHPCPICGRSSWCGRSNDGAVMCRRIGGPGATEHTDTHGATYWIHGGGGARTPVEMPTTTGAGRAAPETLDRVYLAWLRALPLATHHRKDLRGRGLTDAEIDARGYRSMPAQGRADLARQLVEQFGAGTCAQVPGLHTKAGDSGPYWTLGAAAGLLIPVRDPAGQVVALVSRPDKPGDGGKYLWVSSTRHGGPGPGAPVHVPVFTGDRARIRITEGGLKADVATAISGVLTLGIAGCSHWRPVLPLLAEIGPREVSLAWDADARTNHHVAHGLADAAAGLAAAGYTVSLELWDEQAGKGIDDLLHAGGAPTLLPGALAGTLVTGTVAQAAAAEAERTGALDTAARLAELYDAAEWKTKSEAPFAAAAFLATLSAAEYGAAKSRLKAILGRNFSARDLDRAVREHRGKGPIQAPTYDTSLPSITLTNRPLRDISEEALGYLVEHNDPPALFVRGGALARVRSDEKGIHMVEPVSDSMLCARLTRTANFFTVCSSDGGVEIQIHQNPPLEVVRDIKARGTWGMPAIEGITESPVLRPDGSILTEPGYDPESRLFYVPAAGLVVPAIPVTPTPGDLAAATRLILEAIGEFPFKEAASAANALAVLLTPAVRPAIAGNVPMALIDAPQAGTGKGLLTEAIALINTGRAAAMMTAPTDEDEWRKRITATLLTGLPVIAIDNVEHPLGSAHLASALTAREWLDRRLGWSEMVRIPVRVTWVATGNNIRLRGDMPRRSYWIRLDAQQARPWEREGFTHPNLLEWVAENRGRLVAALLTIARAWFAAGRPAAAVKTLGNFEEWSRTLAGILAYAGIDGFLANQMDLYETVDEEGPEWENFLSVWADTIGEGAYTTGDLCRRLNDETGEALRDALPGPLAAAMCDPGASFERRLAKALSRRVDVTYRIARPDETDRVLCLKRASADARKGKARWRVEESDKPFLLVSPFSTFVSAIPPRDGSENVQKPPALQSHVFTPPPPTTGETNGGNEETGKDSVSGICPECGAETDPAATYPHQCSGGSLYGSSALLAGL